jgi:ABC-type cobalamin/Fe3+-siderophores transport system ATPase subunit
MVTYQLSLKNLSLEREGMRVLDKIDLEFTPGEFIGLIGPNGAGKTSLIKILAGVLQDYTGEIQFTHRKKGQKEQKDRSLKKMPLKERARWIGYLPQQEYPAWPLQVEHLVGLGRLAWHKPMTGKSEQDRHAIAQALENTDLMHLKNRLVSQLSGGELQRVLLARVFAGESQIVLADEPIAALDISHQLQIMELLAVHANVGGLVLAALHDLALAARFCSRLILLHQGKIHAQGKPADVLNAQNLAEVYGIDADVECRSDALIIIPKRILIPKRRLV